jgi:regulator of sigma E protease
MTWQTILWAFPLALGILIAFHEYGHYWVARLCGVKVLRFSLGFGKPLLSRRFGPDGTEWALGAFPLGGYVKMLDEREGPVEVHELPRAFNRQPVGKRIAIVLAGPLANFLLTIVIFWLLFVIGMPGAKPILGEVDPKSNAGRAGIGRADVIRSIDGDPVATWQEVRWAFMDKLGEQSSVEIETNDASGALARHRLDLSGLTPDDLDSEFIEKLGLTQFVPTVPSRVGRVLPDSPADQVGLQVGDEIVAIEGKAISDFDQMIKVVSVSAGKPLRFGVRREGREMVLTITPALEKSGGVSHGKIGVGPDEKILRSFLVEVRYGPLKALSRAVGKTWELSVFTLKMMGKMVTGGVSWKNLSGPITIAKVAGQSAQLGWLYYLSFIALISVSLGVLNLLPIPLLDGGHLMYYIAELIKGGPVPERIMEIGQQIGMAILFGLMLFAFYNDINRLITG